MNYRRISFYRSHNLEVPGSSPGWSTDKYLINSSLWGYFFIVPYLLIIENLIKTANFSLLLTYC